MSSCSSAPEVYQKNFFEFFGRVWMARSALARTAPCGQVWETKSRFFQEKQGFRGWGYPLGALQHVHQGNAAATVHAHGLAKMARRTVPYGFSCSPCAHMGRLAPRFSHSLSPQQPRSRPSPPENTASAVPGEGVPTTDIFQFFGEFLAPSPDPAKWCPRGPFLDKKYFLLKRMCLCEVRVQKRPGIFLFLGYCSTLM